MHEKSLQRGKEHANQHCLLMLDFKTTKSPASVSPAVAKQICCIHFLSSHTDFLYVNCNKKHQYALQNKTKTLVCKLTYKKDHHNRLHSLSAKPTIPPQAVFTQPLTLHLLVIFQKTKTFFNVVFSPPTEIWGKNVPFSDCIQTPSTD